MRDKEKETCSRSTGDKDKKHEAVRTAGGCVCCGAYVPEGRDVCPTCERGGNCR